MLQNDILKLSDKGDIIICGDLNARTSSKDDYILKDNSQYIPLFDSYKRDNKIIERESMDSTIDTRGRELLDFCIMNQLRILNGRCFGDTSGKFTCFNAHGASVVDYCLSSERLFDQILSNFVPTLSDCHCQVNFKSLSKFIPSQPDTTNHSSQTLKKFLWNKSSNKILQQTLNSKTFIDKFKTYIDTNDFSNIDISASVFSEILLDAATIAVPSANMSKKTKRKPRKKWFDNDLNNMRKRLISYGKHFQKLQNVPSVRNHYLKLYREYNKMRKLKCRKFKWSVLEHIKNLYAKKRKNIGT